MKSIRELILFASLRETKFKRFREIKFKRFRETKFKRFNPNMIVFCNYKKRKIARIFLTPLGH